MIDAHDAFFEGIFHISWYFVVNAGWTRIKRDHVYLVNSECSLYSKVITAPVSYVCCIISVVTFL